MRPRPTARQAGSGAENDANSTVAWFSAWLRPALGWLSAGGTSARLVGSEKAQELRRNWRDIRQKLSKFEVNRPRMPYFREVGASVRCLGLWLILGGETDVVRVDLGSD